MEAKLRREEGGRYQDARTKATAYREMKLAVYWGRKEWKREKN